MGYGISNPLTYCDIEQIDADLVKQFKLKERWPVDMHFSSFISLHSQSEEEALDWFFSIIEKYAASSMPTDKSDIPFSEPLICLMTDIRKRPNMYFGNSTPSHIFTYLLGASWAEKDNNQEPIITNSLINFQSWVEKRYPYSKNCPWHKTYETSNPNVDNYPVEVFFNDFDLFLNGHSPDKDV